MRAFAGLTPELGVTTSHGSFVEAIHDADGFSVFVMLNGSGAVVCVEEPPRCTAKPKPFGGASVATGAPACVMKTPGDRKKDPTLDTRIDRCVWYWPVFGGTENVIVAGKVVPVAPDRIVTSSFGDVV